MTAPLPLRLARSVDEQPSGSNACPAGKARCGPLLAELAGMRVGREAAAQTHSSRPHPSPPASPSIWLRTSLTSCFLGQSATLHVRSAQVPMRHWSGRIGHRSAAWLAWSRRDTVASQQVLY
jgi:hypothetical protein